MTCIIIRTRNVEMYLTCEISEKNLEEISVVFEDFSLYKEGPTIIQSGIQSAGRRAMRDS